jgi:hypothetical protein
VEAVIVVVLLALIILDVLAFRFGADSRDGFGRRDGRDGGPREGGSRVWWAERERERERERRPAEAPTPIAW